MAYPNSKDSLPTNHVDPPAAGSPEIIHASIINAIAAAINALEDELGLAPSDIYATVADRLAALELVAYNAQAGATYTLTLGDRSKAVVMTATGGSTVTVPANVTAAFPIGTEIRIRQGTSAGQVTIAGAAGVTLVNPFGSFITAAGGAEVKLEKINTDQWSVNGEVA